jgi:predicted extracellular nuclease
VFSTTSRPRALIAASALALIAAALATGTGPAAANRAGTDLVISEVYGAGHNSANPYNADFVELYNPTASPIELAGLSLQYRSAESTSEATGANLVLLPDVSIAAGGHYLVSGAGSTGGTDLPEPDLDANFNASSTSGQVFLASTTTGFIPEATATGSVTDARLVDFVGYGSANRFEGSAPSPASSNATSVARDLTRTQPDTDDNSADFGAGTPTPSACGVACAPPPPTERDATIAEIQGDGSASPLEGDVVTTRGVVTAAYPRGGFFAFVIQTEGTGTTSDATPGASDGLWVKHLCCGSDAEVGQLVEVTGVVEEDSGRTQLVYDPDEAPLKVLDEHNDSVTPLAAPYPTTFAAREAHESELLDLSGQRFTVSNNYATNRFGEIGLATGDTPLVTPTEVADAQDRAAIDRVESDNYARGVVLDDGASWDYTDERNDDRPLPWLSAANTARIGASATVVGPVVLDYDFGDWRLQPTVQVTDEGRDVVQFGDTRRENRQPADVGGDLKIATFNVLNYFNTTGKDYEAAGGECTYHRDRFGDEITTDDCGPTGPRGAAEEEDLLRQQAKIVEAINTMDADVVSLEEIENSVRFGEHRDDALKQLVAALNQAAGTERWARVPSPPAARLPATEDQDVIRTAFIYDPSTVDLVGHSRVLVDSAAFVDAREPLAQAFVAEGGDRQDAFMVIANHFKSKGSGFDDGTGQGRANPTRVAEAEALVDFAADLQQEWQIEKVFLAGDFNAYSMEDPIQAMEDAGYTRFESDTADEWSYSFDGMSGSLDHVLANDAALADVTGVDTWEINANEAVAFEYSRFNENVTQFFEYNVFRASDHNPELVGLRVD